MSESTGCCRWCTSFIFTLGLTALFLWLSLRASKPSCSVQSFYVPALNLTANDPRNATVAIHLRLSNGNKDKGIYYDDVRIALYYNAVNGTVAVGNTSIPAFYQGHNKKATKQGTVKTEGVPWNNAQKNVSANGEVEFRVDLATAVRFKIVWWKTKRHRMNISGRVQVNRDGKKTYNKNIKLSGASELVCFGTPMWMLALSFFFLILC
ncbi:PREDICTED: protein NDR1-like [Nelumbo nucifera]|uniref:Late embryogenesis abundant protein LEA-2 subgroup domain-containing protein n=2 Tax=Nelumbo nucifera TaxID=4432 RepID=A0A822XNG1_NELNU|nr:PREDICTED: protein NDR1-like [Nelumbo nucifera]DAD20589.1 TPA_asm: hypothetical protein HUJ06_022052 [Nelumbo nucifera]